MKTLKKIFIGVFGAGIIAGLKILLTVFSFVCKIMAYIILYFGLEYLFLYLIGSSFLFMYEAITPDLNTLNYKLFWFGVSISIACSILVTIKHFIYNPITRYFKTKLAIRDKIKKENDLKIAKEVKERTQENNNFIYSEIINRYPIVYKSKNNQNIVIFEYEKFYHIYNSNEHGQLIKIDEKPKFIKYNNENNQNNNFIKNNTYNDGVR